MEGVLRGLFPGNDPFRGLLSLPLYGGSRSHFSGVSGKISGGFPPREGLPWGVLLWSWRRYLTMSWKKNQACCRTASRTALPLTTHCRASSSCSSWRQGQGQGSQRARGPPQPPLRA